MRDHMPSQPMSAQPRTSSPFSNRSANGVAFVGEVLDLAVVLKRNKIVPLAGTQINAVNVGAVGHRVRLAKAGAESLAQAGPW